METRANLDFDFDLDFRPEARAEILAEASETARGLRDQMGAEAVAADPAAQAAARLLEDLNGEVARFGAYPDVLELKEEHFTAHGLAVPRRFTDLSQDFRFYWVRIPMTLKPADNRPFVKLQCAVEFNPGVAAGHLRPRAQMILPDKKFKDLMTANTELVLSIGEDFEFHAVGEAQASLVNPSGGAPIGVIKGPAEPKKDGAGDGSKSNPQVPAGPTIGAGGKAKVDVKAAAKAGLVVGPFSYRVRRALLDHSPPGTETVFWSLSDAEFLQGDDLDLVVVLQVPRGVEQVKIAAALQAYHGHNFLAVDLGEVINYVRQRIQEFFRKGAPVPDQAIWDITPSL